MLEPFQLPFVQRGLVEVLILAVAGGLIGTWIVLRGLAFYAHAVGTAAFPGLVLADGLGFAAVLGAVATAALVAVAVGLLARREGARDRYDSLTALVLVAALAVGVILASDVFHSAGNVETLLFGSLLLVGGGDYAFAAVSAASVLIGGLVLGQRWLATGFDPASARALGARSALPDIALLALVALVAVAALSTLGALLATALLVVPAATTRLVCSRLRPWQLATVALVAVEGVAGLWLSVSSTRRPARPSPCSPAGCSRPWPPAGVLGARRSAVAAAAAAALACSPAAAPTSAPQPPARSGSSRPRPRSATSPAPSAASAARVDQILRPNTDPHEYEPRPSDVRDDGRRRRRVRQRRRPRPLDGRRRRSGGRSPGDRRPRRARAAQASRRESQGPEASRYDPHWWHDPRNAEAAVAAIRDALTTADPGAPRRLRAQRRRLPGPAARARRAGSPPAWPRAPGRSASWSPTTTPSATSPTATASRSSAP